MKNTILVFSLFIGLYSFQGCKKNEDVQNPASPTNPINSKPILDEIFEVNVNGLPPKTREENDVSLIQSLTAGHMAFIAGSEVNFISEVYMVELDVLNGIKCSDVSFNGFHNLFLTEQSKSKVIILDKPSSTWPKDQITKRFEKGNCKDFIDYDIVEDYRVIQSNFPDITAEDAVEYNGSFYFIGYANKNSKPGENVMWKYDNQGNYMDHVILGVGPLFHLFIDQGEIVAAGNKELEGDINRFVHVDPSSLNIVHDTLFHWVGRDLGFGNNIYATRHGYFFLFFNEGTDFNTIGMKKHLNDGTLVLEKSYTVKLSSRYYSWGMTDDGGLVFAGIDRDDLSRLLLYKIDGTSGSIVLDYRSVSLKFNINEIYQVIQLADGMISVLCQFQDGNNTRIGLFNTMAK